VGARGALWGDSFANGSGPPKQDARVFGVGRGLGHAPCLGEATKGCLCWGFGAVLSSGGFFSVLISFVRRSADE
jgi:hypothetical protein